MHSLRMCCKILCQNLVVHPKCMLGGSTKFHPFLSSGWGGGWGGWGGSWEFDAEFKFAKIQNSYVDGGWVGGGRGLRNLMLSSNLLKFKIPMLRVGGGFMEFDAEFKFAKNPKIPMLRVGGGVGGCGGFTEFDTEFKFAKNQNSYVEGGWGGVCRIRCWVQIC